MVSVVESLESIMGFALVRGSGGVMGSLRELYPLLNSGPATPDRPPGLGKRET